MKRPLRLLAAVACVLLVWILWSKLAPQNAPPARASAPNSQPAAPVSQLSPGKSALETQPPPPPFPLNSPTTSIAADLRLLAATLETFRTNFPRDGNPIGENAEITAALTGKNKLHLVLIPPHHPAINTRGELCDRWGTPFFFHQISGTQMEIRSAGPDKKLYTSDDVVFTP